MFPSKSGMKVFGGVLLFGVLAYNRPLLYSCFHQSSVEEGLVSVAELGRLQSVKRMLSTGAPVESRKGMWTALGRAVMFGQDAVVEVLLDAGAKINDPNPGVGSALYLAVVGRRESLVRTLLARGADPNLTPEWGLSPLMVAAIQGNVPVAKLLLEGGADATRKSQNGQTALELARAEQHPDVVEVISGWPKR
jgi:ankyrin repeat protein